jgi:hypothetical protein
MSLKDDGSSIAKLPGGINAPKMRGQRQGKFPQIPGESEILASFPAQGESFPTVSLTVGAVQHDDASGPFRSFCALMF